MMSRLRHPMSLLNWFRSARQSPSPPVPASAALAMVLLERPATLDVVELDARLRPRAGELPMPSDLSAGEGGVVAGTIPGGAIALMALPLPVPPSDLEGPIALAWHWPEAATVVPTHGAHIIVHAGSTTLDPVALRLVHTQLVAAIVEQTAALGVYIGHALLVRSAADFLADARDAHDSAGESLPILSWVGFHPVGEDNGTLSAYTTGLEQFGMFELEVRHTSQAVPELLGMLADVALYQLTSGARLKDGDTFGASAEDRRTVRVVQSNFLPETPIVLLEG